MGKSTRRAVLACVAVAMVLVTCALAPAAAYATYDIGNFDIEGVDSYYFYTGSQICPKVTVHCNGTLLRENVDYYVLYGDNTDAGSKGSVMVCNENESGGGSVTYYFDIKEKQDMYRLYNPNSGEHFYTASVVERDHLSRLGWKYEGIGWYAPTSSYLPVYRLYNPNAGEHHYATSSYECDYLVGAGWKLEGIGWYSDDEGNVPVYRQYNPHAFANNHNYTTNLNESNWLVSLGWLYEGIGWYGL